MSDAIIEILKWINDMVLGLAGDKGKLLVSMENIIPELYQYTNLVMESVVMPVAYTVLALFFVLELQKISVRAEGMGGGVSNIGAEVIFRTLFRMILCKLAIDSIPLILNAIYEFTTYITSGIAGLMVGDGINGGGIDIDAITPAIEDLDFWSGLISLLLCFLTFLITMIAVVMANIIIVARFIELYVYFAISPIPVATFPSDELSQIGKNFIKGFAAVCVQGVLIFLVLSFFPILFNSAFLKSSSSETNIFLELMGVMGYSIVLIMAVQSTGKWAKSISNAM